MRTEAETDRAIGMYADTVRRVCFIHLKNYSDVEDVFQEVFLKYILHDQPFESDDHERAWLIRVAINVCKDVLRSFFRRRVCSLDDLDTEPFAIQEEDRGVLDAVLKLPDHYRNVVYLVYYEGYSAVETAKILGKNENTVYTWLSRAKSMLKDTLGGEDLERRSQNRV
jgi:RNA polymerase sigma-70 factor (ECF subfamily)